MPFTSAGLEIRTIGSSQLRVLNARLNVNLDDYDFPVIFVTSVCHQMIAFRYQRLSKTNQHNYSRCKKVSCQSLTRMVASLQVHTTGSTHSKRRCGLDNLLVSIATFYALTC